MKPHRARRRVATLLGCWSIASCAATRDGASAAHSSSAAAPTSNDAASASASAAASTLEAASVIADGMPPAFAAAHAARPGVDASTPLPPAFAGSCFRWAHGPAWSTDCFRSRAECESERKRMAMGQRDTTPCEAALRASCTVVGSEAGDGHERCFGTNGDCGRYRVMLARRGAQTTECVER